LDDAILSQIPDETTEECDLGEGPDVYAQVLKLPQNMREVVLLYYYEEMSIREISQVLQTSEVNIKKRLSRARQKLKLELTESDAE
jgi:RNA polymerase sigma-70 factor (ECF subfamily)